MSTVERALKKLREARGEQASQAAPIARVATESEPPVAGSVPGTGEARDGRPRKSIEIDLTALREAGLLSPVNRELADQYRAIKQPLLRNTGRRGGEKLENANLIMVASALEGEGKTFTCVNLSLSLASEKDWEVLLVDVDCRKPQLSRLLGVDQEPGLMDLLRDKSLTPDSLIMATNIPGLSVLPLGRADDHASELLASSRMTQICELLVTENPRRITVFDSSPLLLTTESSVLSSNVGQIIVVVRANKTPQSSVIEALQQLDPNRAIGLVLNRADSSARHVEYGGYDAEAGDTTGAGASAGAG